jgi:hypothetical protein
MALLLNSAGVSAADPILKGLGFTWLFGASTMDINTLTNAWIDTDTSFPGTNSVSGSLSPAASVVTSGNNGAYTHSTQRLAISSTTGLTAGDYLYLSHGSITPGFYAIASIPVAGSVTFVSNPFAAGGTDQSGVSYQVSWKYNGTVGTAPSTSSAGGTQNHYKVRASDSAANQVDAINDNYVRDAPSGTSYVSIDGKDYTGQTTNDSTPSLSILSGWTNNGGISHVSLANHTGQGVNNFTWSDDTTSEKTLSSVESGGLKLSSGDGIKYGRLLFYSKTGAAVSVGVDISITLDSTAPTIQMLMFGR